ncbi:hypothetical protein OKW50_008364 [Paraburkholderia youngii]|uniref:hypothetical protein n=1 Tax=Paraburkholderia youngii TaxID=2782701 RepID=UPI003D1E1661
MEVLVQTTADDPVPLRRAGLSASSLYLNLTFAQWIGLDLNECLAGGLPSHLLIGDWFFAEALRMDRIRPVDQTYERERHSALDKASIGDLDALRGQYAQAFMRLAAEKIMESRPRVVGFTTMFEQTAASLAIAAAVKASSPDTIVCFGGANCHGPMGTVLREHFPQIDYVFTGEADQTFAPFVKELLQRNAARHGAEFSLAPRNGVVATSPTRDLDELPVPDYSDYFAQLSELEEHYRGRPSIQFESSRGCWWGAKASLHLLRVERRGHDFPREITEPLTRRTRNARCAACDSAHGSNRQYLKPQTCCECPRTDGRGASRAQLVLRD